ncbi:MAG: CDP-diacylglycerol--glycerol-3-phosphate 3-phosphatidyltransferase [Planctomycetia bacterium]|nr:CDP-diacylglycerol--glycerol-3-phosphate 3-phosphatidyltransferase [Planctomycetia bacterium]
MSVITNKRIEEQRVFNVPNQLTVLRLLLSLVLFVLIGFQYYLASVVVFAVAAGTDWLDGYFARKYGQVTNLGRILDPFVDKIIICGTFVFLVAVPDSGVQAWMAVVIVGRELLVTALRSYLEGEGADFSASVSGKLKMAAQCVAAAISLYALYYVHSGSAPGGGSELRPAALNWALAISIWLAVALTIYSGVAYVRRAVALFKR